MDVLPTEAVSNMGDVQEERFIFDSPVYSQRYGVVHNILLDNPWKSTIRKVVDFGCADFKLFTFIKWFDRINEIIEVDVDYEVLKQGLFRLRPIISDYIRRRKEPLTVRALQGNVCDPDHCLLGTDAVICIELIEHLYPYDLDALPFNIFGFIKPKIAIFTTPNADFNVVFPNFKGFRHPDHKFEWNREQFESWATNITRRFPDYSVTFKGIGKGPKGTEEFGYCSQMALFVKKQADCGEELFESTSFGVCRYNCYPGLIRDKNDSDGNYYTLVDTFEYPYDKDDRTIDQKILDELEYGIQLKCKYGMYYNDITDRLEIPIYSLTYNCRAHIASESEARELLEKANYVIEQCIVGDTLETCVVCEPDREDSRSSTPSSTRYSDSDWSTTNDQLEDHVTSEPEIEENQSCTSVTYSQSDYPDYGEWYVNTVPDDDPWDTSELDHLSLPINLELKRINDSS